MPELKSKVKSQKSKVTENNKENKSVNLSIPVYSIDGKADGTMKLPEEIFGQKVNKKLLAQAARVYSTNEKTLFGSTKTRGEVRGSTKKIYSQKGTGRARHGGIRAPIFVGGGIVFGPTPRNVVLDLPKKMKKVSLLSALSDKILENLVFGISGLEKLTGKTKEISKLLSAISLQLSDGKKVKKNKSVLIVTGEKNEKVQKSVRNIKNATILPVNLINSWEVISHEILLITKEAVEELEARSKKQESKKEEIKSQKLEIKTTGEKETKESSAISRQTIKATKVQNDKKKGKKSDS